MDKRLQKILDHYGKEIEQLKCCEECAELIQALLKGNPIAMAQEIADVEITIEYMKESFKLHGLVDLFKEFKIERQLARMENEEESK